MATLAQLETALRAADAAGNTDDARRLAKAYAAARSQQAPQAKPQLTLAERYAAQGIDPNEGLDPTEGQPWQVNAAAGFGKALVDTGRGIKQLFGGYTPQEIEEQRRIDAPLMADGAGMAGNIAGTVAQLVGPGGAVKLATKVPTLVRAAPVLSKAGRALLPSTARGMTAQGAVVGAMQPVGTNDSRVLNASIGAGAGLVGGGVPRAIGWTGNKLSGLFPAVTAGRQERAAAGVLNQFAHDPLAMRMAAANPQMIVPGSMPTLAEASGDVGLSGLQRTLANTPEFGNELAMRGKTNNLARVGYIESNFGGADDQAAAAIRSTRDAEAGRILRPVAKLPMTSLNKVVAGVSRLAEKHQASPAVRTAMDAVNAELPNIRTVADAHDVRQFIGQLIKGQVEGKAGAKLARRELMTVQGLLDREMRAAYPEWGTFLRDYKSLSREADRVAVGAELLATGRAVRIGTNEPDLTPAAFGRAAGNMDRTVQRATGFNKATAERTLTPDQVKAVDAVRRDLERYSRASTDGKAIGSNTMQNAVGGNRLQDAAGPLGAAMIEPASGVAMLVVNGLRKSYGEKVAGLVSEAMLDPARAAEILARLPPNQRASIVRQIAHLIPRAGGVAGVSVVPAVE